jgi:uncharacterized membrane protein YkvA (DUF1232 family)
MARSGPTIPGVDPLVADRVLSDPLALLTFVKNVAWLFKDCVLDTRVPRRDKWILAAVAIYLLSPIDLIPDAILGLGQIDDLVVAVWGLRQLLRGAGASIVEDLWRGSDDGLAVVLGAAGMHNGKDTQ